jgi:hypothetical protein
MKFKNVIYMKTLKKIILFCIFSITLLSTFLIPRTYAQEWTYDGADTVNIPNFSVYPSEWYTYTQTLLDPEILSVGEITHGNITDIGPGPGYCVYGNAYMKNMTSGAISPIVTESLMSYWNDTIGLIGGGMLLPVEIDGKVSENILNNASSLWEGYLLSGYTFEQKQVYPNLYSLAFWNETYNNAYIHCNYTDDGLLASSRCEFLPFGNLTLYSQPAQLPPLFSFTTEFDTLNVNSTDIALKVAIIAADNNNNGVIDTDYQYRVLNGSTWTSWASIPPLIDIDLGSVPAGNYTVSMEVKNMYGITQEQIEIQYDPPGDGEEPIPGYSTILISIALFIGVSFLIHKYRKKE